MEAFADKDRATEQAPTGEGAAGVVVLGPGRSGTSAIARAFVAAGFFAGAEDDLYGPDRGNPLGHLESLAALEVDEELLGRFGCDWWADAPAEEEQLPHRSEVVPRLRAIVDSLISSAGGVPAMLKEPRISGLLPLWWPALEGVLHPVLAIRDPLEVALSHSERDGTSIPHALASWEAQTTAVLRQLDGEEATIAPYAQLTARSETAREVVEAAAAHLDSRRAGLVRPRDAGSALRPDLRRQDAGGLDHADYLTPRQLRLWEYARSLPLGRTRLEPPPELRAPSTAARETTRRESERVRLRKAHARLVDELEKASARESALERRLEDAGKRLADVTALARREAASADRNTRELAQLRESASWKLTAPLRRAKRMLRGSRG
jgi:hypothetical protein